MACLGWLLNLGFAGGTSEAVEVPDAPGIERTASDNRLHARAADNRLDAISDDNRLHARAKESGH